MTKKIIKLINNERITTKIASAKACDATSEDHCKYDYAMCTIGSYDLCVKDYAGCTNHSFDYCGNSGGEDYHACYEGNTDTL